MRTSTLLAIGLGAAAVTMMNPNRRKKMMQMIEPMMNNVEIAEMMPTKETMKKMQKQVMRTFS